MEMPVGDIVSEIVVILTAVGTLLLASFTGERRQWLAAPLALTGLAVSGVILAGQIGEARFTFFGTWAIDGASVWARLMILAGTALVILISPDWFRTDKRHGEYYAILLFSALGAMALAGAADLLQLIMGVLLSSVTGYTLAAYHRDWPLSVEAGMKYFLVGAFANAILVVGVALVFGMVGATGYGDIAAIMPEIAPSPLLLLGLALIVVGVAFKLGAVPAHAWMPDVAEGAPAPAAAFLTVVPKIGAAIALFRIVDLFPADTFTVRPLIAILAAATMTLGNLAALWQDDFRRMLGWSSVSQSGYALMAVTVVGLSDSALSALLVFLAGYAISNLAAFAVVAHLRGRTDRTDYAGLAGARPAVAVALIAALLSLVGIPPLAGFFGKLTLFIATIDGGYAWLAVVALANTVISLFYYLRFIAPVYFAKSNTTIHTLGSLSVVAVATSAVGVVLFALFAGPIMSAFVAAGLTP